MSADREHFSSKLGFILAAAGSAVGIGNLVGFPVAAAKNGGGAFLFIYAIFVIVICLPVMMAEMALGRSTNKDPLGAYTEISEGDKKWKVAGLIGVITPFMIGVFYLVITVWIFGYLAGAITGDLDLLANPNTFGEFITGKSLFGYMVGVVALTGFILMSGVKQGIERAAKILMPTLFMLLVMLVIYVLTLDNAMAGVKFYILPDFSKITASVVSGALSQAFFSLSLGMGILITYGSYMNRNQDIADSSKLVALTDTGVAFVAGLMIMPAIFSFDPQIDPSSLSESSISLIFVLIPKIFLSLQTDIGYFGASAIASVFFLLVFFAAITSLVSIIEVPNAALMEQQCISRKKSLVILGLMVVVLSVFASMSFGMSEFFTKFVWYAGADKSLFDVIYDVFYDTILPLNGLLICLFVSMRWKKHNFNNALKEGAAAGKHSFLFKYSDVALSTVIPLILFVIFANTVALKFFGVNLLF
ncbi:sodium-dependent transporter [Psychrosphaera sp. B3R10]|uniref:Sodium-dependent transporter n=1 Tax=Psychrosphaera algicola TaxID=3023714 RepID=A0ABT5FJS8_9GAMM|nr:MULTISPECIES: sodium-dependent transporter [unclassified Psychrosphaera]MBU2880940.1 sodium-dependent transporter [Psychrosphaera sp. I2R16]MBU2990841.1 sodium-dependent transporter [Psychrosphaera sp. B3R10]MDC2891426.1 sodium-dependent transporter [Psychrosphaera sp. G1-22]MDO6720537.1 sodium-dependent transporter [Psychrosphaera sp. 1_MG-2023]